jgi:hypothetical protein
VKFLCASCERLLELSNFRIEGSALVVRCIACGEESKAEGSSATAASSPPVIKVARPISSLGKALPPTWDLFGVPAGFCPKCIATRPANAQACPQCGLSFDSVEEGDYRPPPNVATLWSELAPDWEESEAHDHFLKAAFALGELAAAGRLYRLRLAQAPADLLAARGRDEVLRLATVGSPVFNKEPANVQRVLRWQHVALGVFILLTVAVLVILVGQFAKRAP